MCGLGGGCLGELGGLIRVIRGGLRNGRMEGQGGRERRHLMSNQSSDVTRMDLIREGMRTGVWWISGISGLL